MLSILDRFRKKDETPPVYLRVGSRRVKMPKRKSTRITLGFVFVVAGAVPVPPGPFVIPIGLAFWSVDFPVVRRWRRSSTVWWYRRRERREAVAIDRALQRFQAQRLAARAPAD